MMKIKYNVDNELPSLAWIGTVKNDTVNVLCGGKVEIYDSFFVEGTWGGKFDDADFDDAEWFCGTGGRIRGDSIVFATPTGMHAALFLLAKASEVILSNSLPLLMAYCDHKYDSQYVNYSSFFQFNINRGFLKYDQDVHTVCDDKVCSDIKMILFRNIEVDCDGNIMFHIKRDTKGFETFEEYYSRLKDTMICMGENARNIKRKIKYATTSYISSGYDSACCAALAKDAGANKVLTFKAEGKYAGDSGIGTAKALGYHEVVERYATEYKSRTDYPEIESLSGGDMGYMIEFSSFAKDARDHMIFSGQNGDLAWMKSGFVDGVKQIINNEIIFMWRNSEIGMGEAHIHQEYIPVPMPSFGLRHLKDLYRISNSDEMRPWSVGGDYDRPIPRRILEERGVPRETFGIKKHGGGLTYQYDSKRRIINKMSKNSAEDFKRYLKDNHSVLNPKKYIEYVWLNKDIYWNAIAGILHLNSLQIEINPNREQSFCLSCPFAPRHLIPWAGNRMIYEYRRIVEKYI